MMLLLLHLLSPLRIREYVDEGTTSFYLLDKHISIYAVNTELEFDALSFFFGCC